MDGRAVVRAAAARLSAGPRWGFVGGSWFDVAVTTVGAVFLPQFPPERLRSVAEAADEAGLAQLWLWEDCFWEGGIATAAAALAWTERLQVGVGLLPVPLRNVALTAMELATLHRLFPGRPLTGVGHGVQDWMGQVGARAGLAADAAAGVRRRAARAAGRGVGSHAGPVRAARPGAAGRAAAGRTAGAGRGGGAAHARGWSAGTPTARSSPAARRRSRSSGPGSTSRRAGPSAGRTGPHPVTVYVLAAGGPDARPGSSGTAGAGACRRPPTGPPSGRSTTSPPRCRAGPRPAWTPWCCSPPPTSPTPKASWPSPPTSAEPSPLPRARPGGSGAGSGVSQRHRSRLGWGRRARAARPGGGLGRRRAPVIRRTASSAYSSHSESIRSYGPRRWPRSPSMRSPRAVRAVGPSAADRPASSPPAGVRPGTDRSPRPVSASPTDPSDRAQPASIRERLPL